MLPAPLVPRTDVELQIAVYRRMTGEERLALALRLHESICAIARLGIRARHPEASDDELQQGRIVTERELLAQCLRRLNSLGMPYMLTGSMASRYWGIPRSTHDLDFVVEEAPDREGRIAAALAPEFSAEAPASAAPWVLRAADPRSVLRIDFWNVQGEGFARQAFSRRQRISLFGEAAWIATAEDTLLHKLRWNRVDDAAGIVAVQAENLDRSYLAGWGGVLGVEAVLEDLMARKVRPKQT